MARPTHYSPVIRRELVRALYYERVRQKIPMTRLVENILTDALRQTDSWRLMETPDADSPSARELSQAD